MTLKPGIVLSFDDAFIDDWLAVMPLLTEYNARITFFVSPFDKLDATQRDGLRQLAEAGHAVGCHGLRHCKAVEAVAALGPDGYLNADVRPAVEVMQQAGYPPTSFAYPCSQRNEQTDELLKGFFHHVRTGMGWPNPDAPETHDDAFTPVDQVAARFCLPGLGIDRLEPGAGLDRVVTRAADRKEIVIEVYYVGSREKAPY